MGLLKMLGIGKKSGPAVPLIILAGASRSGRKDLINRITEGFGPETRVSVVLYDLHDAEQAIRQTPNIGLHVYTHEAIKCPCHGDGSDPIRKSVKAAVRADEPDVAILQVGRGKDSQEVLRDVVRLEGQVSLAGLTAVLNAESALNDLRDADDEVGSYVRAAGQVYISHVAEAQERTLEALRKRVSEINSKAVIIEDPEKAVQNIRKQVYAAASAANRNGG